MNISKQMIRDHLRYLFLIYDDRYEESPEIPKGYKKDIENMKLNILYFGELEAMKLALEHILSHPEINILEFVESNTNYEEEDVREIIQYAWEVIWPDTSPMISGASSEVRLVDIPLDKWRARELPSPL